MAASLAACGNSETETTAAPSETAASTQAESAETTTAGQSETETEEQAADLSGSVSMVRCV